MLSKSMTTERQLLRGVTVHIEPGRPILAGPSGAEINALLLLYREGETLIKGTLVAGFD